MPAPRVLNATLNKIFCNFDLQPISGSTLSSFRKRVFEAIAVCWCLTSLSAPDSSFDNETPIHIRGDDLRGDMTTRTVISGSVTLDQGNIHVEADSMTIDWLEGEVQRITANGDKAHFTRTISKDNSSIDARARNIIYHRELNQIELQGMAFLRQGGSQFRGENILYDIGAGLVKADSGMSGGVEFIWDPRE